LFPLTYRIILGSPKVEVWALIRKIPLISPATARQGIHLCLRAAGRILRMSCSMPKT
jgi:hypothetical protein